VPIVDAVGLRARLKKARRDVAESQRLILRQIDIILKLQYEGCECWRSRHLLAELQKLHALRVADHDCIEHEIAATARGPTDVEEPRRTDNR
jgi:hypothetical protein